MGVPGGAQPVPGGARPVVPTPKAHWPGYGTKATGGGGTCTSGAYNPLVAVGPLAATHTLGGHEVGGDASPPGAMWGPGALQGPRGDPAKMALGMAHGGRSTNGL